MIKRDYKTDIDLNGELCRNRRIQKLSNARPLRKPEGYLACAMTSGSFLLPTFYFLIFTFFLCLRSYFFARLTSVGQIDANRR